MGQQDVWLCPVRRPLGNQVEIRQSPGAPQAPETLSGAIRASLDGAPSEVRVAQAVTPEGHPGAEWVPAWARQMQPSCSLAFTRRAQMKT